MMAYDIDNRLVYLPSVKEVQEVNEQLEILGHHPIVGLPGTTLGYAFERILAEYKGSFSAAFSCAYELGRIAGIRQERARRKKHKA